YKNTQQARTGLRGSEHGDSAAQYLMGYIANRLAAPGFSLHNSGIAIDFSTHDSGSKLGPSTSQRAAWRHSWFYAWLTSNAQNFGFFENPKIDEPWHWELRNKVQVVTFSEPDAVYAKIASRASASCDVAADNKQTAFV